LNTIFLSDEEVAAYLKDFWSKLVALKEEMPKLWCPIGPSGGTLAQAAMQVAGDAASKVMHVPIAYDRATEIVSFPSDPDHASLIAGKRVLLLDGSIHSGSTFQKAYQAIEAMEPAEISSYSLVVRVGASILPNHFGLMIGDYDRAIFLKKVFPNNRLFACGCVRKLADADQAHHKILCGRDFVDKFSWGDLWYEMTIDPRRQTYVYQRNGNIKAFVSFRVTSGDDILLDTIAVDKSCQGQGIAGNLMRWTETCGRNSHCATIHLWAVDDRSDWYAKRGYDFCDKELLLDGMRFHLMRKKLLYNLPDDHVLTMGA
jgi:GNAT superfamily N-acetyltransferase